MTDCTQTKFQFSSIKRQKVEADFGGGSITSNGGLILLGEIERKLNISHKIASILPDHRDTDKITHTQESMILQRLMGLCAAHEDLNDHDDLRHDPLMAAKKVASFMATTGVTASYLSMYFARTILS